MTFNNDQNPYLKMSLLLRLTLLFVICSVIMETANGACCRRRRGRCGDCTKPTPCCGYRKCNIFCCGCKCRKGRCSGRRKRQLSYDTTDSSAYGTFMGLDINKNGMMEQFEFSKAMEQMQITDNMTVLHHWSVMDEDKDGLITMEEFDREKL
ncbi:unnamed protein product [Mytilus coruscus]|uniref:EF-hand domain-containing protein n=1 Tax=Mytilus coruscus TaxID=42192 RepID=A0A6J8E1X1_MYTCO|nr:unnamed protein product [Mytilus coruscus]